MSATERFYKSDSGLYENVAEIEVSLDGTDTPLAGVDCMVCELSPSGAVIDSDASAGAIEWTAAGVVTLDLAKHDFGESVPTGVQYAKLIAFDPDHTGGQVVAHRAGADNKLILIFSE